MSERGGQGNGEDFSLERAQKQLEVPAEHTPQTIVFDASQVQQKYTRQ